MAKGTFERRGENSWRLTVDMGFNALGERERRRKTISIDDGPVLKAVQKLMEANPNVLMSSASLNRFIKSGGPAELIRHANRVKQFFDEELMRLKVEAETSDPQTAPAKMPFRELAKVWREKYAPGLYSPRTLVNYVERLESHVIPFFERYFVDEIRPLHVLNFRDFLTSPEARKDGRDGSLSPSAQFFIFKVLIAVLNAAVDLKLIPENPAKSVPAPRVPKTGKKRINAYGDEEAAQVILAMLQLPKVWQLYFFGAMMGGFRRGELLALEWPDVDFENNRIFIGKSISWTENGEPAIKSTKEDNEEWVDMPVWYMRELKEFKEHWDAEKNALPDKDWLGGDRQFVFHSGFGKPYYHSTPTLTWRRFLKKTGLRHIRLHDLRHTTATLLAEDGVDLKLIQERLRHSKFETTADFYTHVTRKASRGVANRLERFDPQQLAAAQGDEKVVSIEKIRYRQRKVSE
jgi:integrase